jgi:putative transposase
MKPPPDPHYRHRFPAEIISHAVWLYHVFSLSLRDVELLLAEHGIVVSYETIRQWCKKFGRFCRKPFQWTSEALVARLIYSASE